jgi:hypothetical protein
LLALFSSFLLAIFFSSIARRLIILASTSGL